MDFTSKNAPGLYFRKNIRKDLQTVSLDADMIRLLLVIGTAGYVFRMIRD